MFYIPKPNLDKLKDATRKLDRALTATINNLTNRPKNHYVPSHLKIAVKRKNVNLILNDIEKDISSFLNGKRS